MEWEFSADQINDGELTFSLMEFTNKLYKMVCEDAGNVMGTFIPKERVLSRDAEFLDDFYIQYYICYYNYMLCLATDRSRRNFISHTKRLNLLPEIKTRFIDKKFLIALAQEQVDTVDMFKAVLKRFVSELIESGISTNRLPQIIYMQQLNSFSSIIPSIIKNEAARKMLIKIEFHGSFTDSLKKIFRIPTGV